jgi:SAM-dependent methyltransferase
MKKSTFEAIKKNEQDWWLETKAKIITEILSLHFPSKSTKIFDIASGTGYIAKQIKNVGYKNITVSDKSRTALMILSKDFSGVLPINLPVLSGIDEKFDCILLLDVLEHIDDDYASLQSAAQLLKKKGKIIITVPAFEFLWSKKDIRVEHKRRYTKKTLERVISHAGLQVEYISYYNFFLFIPALLYSIINKDDEKIPRYNSLQNLLFKRIFLLEKPLIKRGIKFPFGVSVIAVVKYA